MAFPFALVLFVVFFASSTILASRIEERGGYFSGAYWISGQDLTSATAAQCPSYAPISCSSIQEPDYCCSSGNYCAYASDQSVGCCPWGQTCSGQIGGVATTTTQQSVWTSPTSTYWQQSTVYVTQNGLVTTTVYGVQGVQTTQQVTTQQVVNGQYCSTLYAHGDNLPTTEAGTCGTILIENTGVRLIPSVSRLVIAGAFLVAVGALVLQIRS